MIIIGLTGPTGSGKSSAATVAKKLGFKVVDCDSLARVAVEKGTDGLSALVIAFGKDILCSDGTLNRKALAKKAYSSPEKTELLNKTILPYIAELVKQETVAENKVLLDAPTLFESGINTMCDATVAVLANTDIRLKRIMTRDKIEEDAAMLRINAGKNDDFYFKNADYVIYNNSQIQAFTEEFEKIITAISGKLN